MGPANVLLHIDKPISELQSCSDKMLLLFPIFCKVGSSGVGFPLTVHVRVKAEPFFIRVLSASSVVVLACTRNVKYYGKLALLYLFELLNNTTIRSIIRRYVHSITDGHENDSIKTSWNRYKSYLRYLAARIPTFVERCDNS